MHVSPRLSLKLTDCGGVLPTLSQLQAPVVFSPSKYPDEHIQNGLNLWLGKSEYWGDSAFTKVFGNICSCGFML